MPKGMLIPSTTKLLQDCWLKAENRLRIDVQRTHYDPDEEPITFLFMGFLRESLTHASNAGLVCRAFGEDLQQYRHEWDQHAIERLVANLEARAVFHDKDMEKNSGGDLGLSISRPDFSNDHKLGIGEIPRIQNGILCQAKKTMRSQQKRSFFRSLTDNQKSLYPARRGYLVLLLYRLMGIQQNELRPFEWHLCSSFALEDIKRNLASDAFPQARSSDQILDQLSKGEIGTSDKKIIEQYICPPSRPTLTISIDWGGDDPVMELQKVLVPPSRTELQQKVWVGISTRS